MVTINGNVFGLRVRYYTSREVDENLEVGPAFSFGDIDLPTNQRDASVLIPRTSVLKSPE